MGRKGSSHAASSGENHLGQENCRESLWCWGWGGEGRPVLLGGTLQEKPGEPGSFVGQGTDGFGVWVLLGGEWDYFGGKQLKEVELMEVKESAQFPSFWQSLALH